MTRKQNATQATDGNASRLIGNPGAARQPERGQNQPLEVGSSPVESVSVAHATPKPAIRKTTATPKCPRHTKSALLRSRLTEPGGASVATLMELTGWQAHTLRASLTGLRKAGLTITRRREGTDTIYSIDTAGSALSPDDQAAAERKPAGLRSAAERDSDVADLVTLAQVSDVSAE